MTNCKPLLALGLMLMLTACGTIQGEPRSTPTLAQPSTTTPTPTSGISLPLICSELQIVQLSKADTTVTKEQVEANNHVLTALCHK